MSKNYILYDGDCPFCTNYVTLVKLREAIGPIDLLNAREHPELVAEYTQKGYNLDKGMILKLEGEVYFGADCIHSLALLSTQSDAFNKITSFIFSSPCLSRCLYPVLRCGRNLTLRLLGRRSIHDKEGLFSVLNFKRKNCL